MRVQAPLVATSMVLWSLVTACQDYPFELRNAKRVQLKKIREVIATITPVDILFVVDNSGSMQDEIAQLEANVGLIADELAGSETDLQVGIITPDIECNLPDRSCEVDALEPDVTVLRSSYSCCKTAEVYDIPRCEDRDIDSDGIADSSNCDGGRLRAAASGRRIFARPEASQRAAWVADFKEILAGLGTHGSALEGGLEAARRAVSCAAGTSCDAEDAGVAAVNRGFIRPEADLVVIFITDEDECSFSPDDSNLENHRTPYHRIQDPAAPDEQSARLCSPDECYAYLGEQLDEDLDGLMDWADAFNGLQSNPNRYFSCGPLGVIGQNRQVNPPMPSSVDLFIDALVAAKGGDVGRIRGAGIVSAVPATAPLGYEALACVDDPVLGPSEECGCYAGSNNPLFCDITSLLGQRPDHFPDPPTGGCLAMAGGRYVRFLERLATRRVEAGARTDTLVDSICRGDYAATLYAIVHNVVLTSCFGLGVDLPDDQEDLARVLEIKLNGEPLAFVEQESSEPGVSFNPLRNELCLEGGLKKEIGQEYEIFILVDEELGATGL